MPSAACLVADRVVGSRLAELARQACGPYRANTLENQLDEYDVLFVKRKKGG
jgi:hypothetical protein